MKRRNNGGTNKPMMIDQMWEVVQWVRGFVPALTTWVRISHLPVSYQKKRKMMIDPEVEINEVLGIDVLVVNVFTRLSVTSVGRCRCVCKSWYHSLTDSVFINDLHLNNTIHRRIQICAGLDEDDNNSYTIYRFIDAYKNYMDNGGSQFKFEIRAGESKSRIYTKLVGSCNGLLCVDIRFNDRISRSRTIGLWNPVTRDYKIAPFTPLPDKYTLPVVNLAFGYDHHNDDYKILRIVHESQYKHQQVDMYSLRSNSWVSLNDSAPPELNIRSYRYTVFNGCIYMVVISSYAQPGISKIMEFCLKDNSFRWEPPMPPDLPFHNSLGLDFFNLKNIGGQLTAFQFYHSPSDLSKLKLWTFKEETREWITRMTISPMGYELGLSVCNFMEPLCSNLDGQLVVVCCTTSNGLTRLVLFDPKRSTRSVLGDFLPTGAPPYGARGYLGQLTYIESLVSPSFFDQQT